MGRGRMKGERRGRRFLGWIEGGGDWDWDRRFL